MPRPVRPWFRFYVEACHDRKLRRLKPSERWLWVAVLAIARQSCRPGWLLISPNEPFAVEDIADFAAMASREVAAGVDRMCAAGMLEQDEATLAWFVPAWDSRQYESDTSTDRTRKHRSNVVPGTPVGTPPETEADTETETPSSNSDLHGACSSVDEKKLQQALGVYVERKLRAANGSVRYPKPWKREVLATASAELGPKARDWLTRYDVTASQIADALIEGSVPASWSTCRRSA